MEDSEAPNNKHLKEIFNCSFAWAGSHICDLNPRVLVSPIVTITIECWCHIYVTLTLEGWCHIYVTITLECCSHIYVNITLKCKPAITQNLL